MSTGSVEATHTSDLYEYPHRAETDQSIQDHRGASSLADLASSDLDIISFFDCHRRRPEDRSTHELLLRRVGGNRR